MIRMTLPLPPSANRYWRSTVVHGRPRVLVSRDGREYQRRAELLAAAQLGPGRPHYLKGTRLRAHLLVVTPTWAGDTDNRVKPTLDALQGLVYAKDSQVVDLGRVVRAVDRERPRVDVLVEPAPDRSDALEEWRELWEGAA